MWGQLPVWIDLRDFVAWIGRHISLKAPTVRTEDVAGPSAKDEVPDNAQNPDALYYDRDLVIRWAENFSNRLSKNERDVYKLSYGASLNLREMARELNYKGSSGPKYILECINGKLRLFLRDLPWLSPDDFNRDAFSLFMDTVISILKKGPAKP